MPQVFALCSSTNCSSCDIQDRHLRIGAERSHVLKRHMRAAVGLGRHAGVGAEHAHVRVVVAAGQEDLIRAAARGERAEAVDKWDLSADGHTGSRADHIGLHDADVERLLREGGKQTVRADRTGKIAFQIDNLAVLRHQLLQSFRKDFSQLQFTFSYRRSHRPSLLSCSSRSASAAA